jgi:hypothetical protein
MNFPERLTINVTDRHIGTGICANPTNCPIALAVIDTITPLNLELPMAIDVSTKIYLNDTANLNHRQWVAAQYSLPAAAKAFIEAFDNNEHVTPISFEAELEYQHDSRN